MTAATILIQTDTPDTADDVQTELAVLGRAVHTTGPYDVLLEVNADGPDALGRVVVAVQAVEHVARTLTLPHVDEEDTR